jgi:hypothetical protein
MSERSPARLAPCALGSEAAGTACAAGARCTTNRCGAVLCTCIDGKYRCSDPEVGTVCEIELSCAMEGHPDCYFPPGAVCGCADGHWRCVSGCPEGCPSNIANAVGPQTCSLPASTRCGYAPLRFLPLHRGPLPLQKLPERSVGCGRRRRRGRPSGRLNAPRRAALAVGVESGPTGAGCRPKARVSGQDSAPKAGFSGILVTEWVLSGNLMRRNSGRLRVL